MSPKDPQVKKILKQVSDYLEGSNYKDVQVVQATQLVPGIAYLIRANVGDTNCLKENEGSKGCASLRETIKQCLINATYEYDSEKATILNVDCSWILKWQNSTEKGRPLPASHQFGWNLVESQFLSKY